MAGVQGAAKPASSARVTKLALYLLHRMRVTTRDGRQLVGGLIGFDKHLNLVLKDCEEFRALPKQGGASPTTPPPPLPPHPPRGRRSPDRHERNPGGLAAAALALAGEQSSAGCWGWCCCGARRWCR